MRFVSLISSGIDSPVATYLISKKAEEMILIHGDIKPFTDERELKNFKLTHFFQHYKFNTPFSTRFYSTEPIKGIKHKSRRLVNKTF